ncbi:MAG: rhomboid family intramembrane serine protease [Synechococcales bacterium]|nr:rhomboid family intramembrane serine protease [Synechococcales bacterium]
MIWRSISGAIALLLGITWLSENTVLQWGSLGIWFLLLGLPLIGFAQVQHWVVRENYRSARKLMTSLRWLHPWDGWWEYPSLLHALRMAQQGNLQEALDLLQHHQDLPGQGSKLAMVYLHRMTARWSEYLAWCDRHLSAGEKLQASAASLLYLRALGEVGQLEALVECSQRLLMTGGDRRDPFTRALIRLYLFAFCGYPEVAQVLLSEDLRQIHPNLQQFWLATAQWQRGQTIALETLSNLQEQVDMPLQNAITWRLAHPVDLPEQLPEARLSAESQAIVQKTLWAMEQESRYRMQPATQPRKAPITYGLMGINLTIFMLPLVTAFLLKGALSIWSDWMPPDLLLDALSMIFSYEWGVMLPREVLAGQFWRLLSSMFLHANFAHLFANLMSLFILGGIVEPLLGKVRFLLTYFGAGIGSMAIVAAISIWQRDLDQGVLGASGAIMGLLGALAAIYLNAWTRQGEKVAARQLRSVITIAVLQTLFDAMTPQVSMSGHLAGLFCGFVVTIILLLGQKRSVG